MKETVLAKKPLKALKDGLLEFTEDELDRGDMSRVGANSHTICQAKMEAKAKKRGDPDVDKSLVKLQRLWCKQEVELEKLALGGKRANNAGFVHNIRAGAERAMDMWSHAALKIYRDWASTG
jgi:hypothetical protein